MICVENFRNPNTCKYSNHILQVIDIDIIMEVRCLNTYKYSVNYMTILRLFEAIYRIFPTINVTVDWIFMNPYALNNVRKVLFN